MSEIVRLAIDSLRNNKLRSSLTVLGVVIGVATVIGMSSIISGLNRNITSQIEELGSNLIFVERIPPTVGGRLPPDVFNRKKLTMEDARAIRDLPLIHSVAPVLQHFPRSTNARSFAVRYRDRIAKNTIFRAGTTEVAVVMNLQIASGRWINEAEDRHKANVVVLGHDTAEALFPLNVDPVGKEVEIEDRVFRIIGVLHKVKSLASGRSPDDNIILMPVGTFWKLHPEQRDFAIVVKAVSQEAMPRAIQQIERLLRVRRGVSANAESDFSISTQNTFTDLWKQISSGTFTVMLIISSIALVVGGVGIMNIMLVSVTERTREIGVRKAVGATRRNILCQFLFEALALTSAGGIIGILVGSGIAVLIRTLVPFLPAEVSLFWVGVAFISSAATGLVFGIYPAYRAARLNPIDALRYE
jgi:putative ABC transport system permease protein